MQYTKQALREIIFPLGGIGTGSIGLAGNGRLVDWEIFNRPDKGSVNGYSHLAIKAEYPDGSVVARVINSDLETDLIGQYGIPARHMGYGFGPLSQTMCGLPHFRDCVFYGEFPVARLVFTDPDFPGEVTLTAFNPLIPMDSENSSLPAAFFRIEVRNTTAQAIRYTAAVSVNNPFKVKQNTSLQDPQYAMIHLKEAQREPSDPQYGDLTVACERQDALCQTNWYRGSWQDGIVTFWRQFSAKEDLPPREYDEPSPRSGHGMCTLARKFRVEPEQTGAVRFVLTWNVPNCQNDWNPPKEDEPQNDTWKNYYATRFADSRDSARYALDHWDSLWTQTDEFRRAMMTSTLDPAVLDAVSATLSVIKTATVLRLEDGSFYGWEGQGDHHGSCEGTCSHVWNYAYALCFLFPDLERSIRQLEYTYSLHPDGRMAFRLFLPLGRENPFRACVDGQMGAVVKTYREWKLCGDDAWLKSVWQQTKASLHYAWSPDNPDAWDADRDGVLEGRQHHTLDMELFGPSSWLEGMYLAALKAAERMARHLGDPDAETYAELFRKGYAWTRDNLFNGSYFIHKLDLNDRSILDKFGCSDKYWNEETGEIKYQVGEGSIIDQVLAQWHADLCGLGDIFDPDQLQTALQFMFDHNYKPSIRNYVNPWRIFCLNDEAGTVICDYPEGARKPSIPVPYCEETMTGFEYALAGLMISRGMISQGLTLVRAVRDRYDGVKRNPWNEIECGSHYARSMATFALLPLFSGLTFDMGRGEIGFCPKVSPTDYRCLFSIGTGWGQLFCDGGSAGLRLSGGQLTLRALSLPFAAKVTRLTADGRDVPFTFEEGTVRFSSLTVIKELSAQIDLR